MFNTSEPFLESVPQVHILLVLWALRGAAGCDLIDAWDPIFITSFATSALTAAFGMSKFLKTGPCHIIRNDSYLMGFGTLTYVLLIINIIATFVGKAFIFPLYIGGWRWGKDHINRQWMAIMTLNFIPQILHVSFLCYIIITSCKQRGSQVNQLRPCL